MSWCQIKTKVKKNTPPQLEDTRFLLKKRSVHAARCLKYIAKLTKARDNNLNMYGYSSKVDKIRHKLSILLW